MVEKQLRAGSILEAVRIRKTGYGYRIGYDDFGEKYWPILGERVYETDHEVVKMIFAKAAEIADPSLAETLQPGLEWQCGMTKLCMKDSARLAIESTLHKVETEKATMI